MLQRKLKNLSLTCISLLVTGCSFPGTGTDSGYVTMNIKFPAKTGFNIKVIPEATEKFEIKITGAGLDEARLISISRTGGSQEQTKVERLPEGAKTIEIKAFGPDNKILAQATKDTVIERNKIASVTVELQEILKNLRIKLNNYPGSGVIALTEIKQAGGASISRMFEGTELNVEKIDLQNAEIKVAVLDSGAAPVALASGKLEADAAGNVNVNLSPAVLPTSINLQADNSVPRELLDALKKAEINFPGNNKPATGDIEFKINNVTRLFNPFVDTCINPGDRISVTVNATDQDNDPLFFFWAKTSSKGSGFVMEIQQEKGKTFSRSGNEFTPGKNAIGFILGDRKSFLNPVSIPLFLRDEACP